MDLNEIKQKEHFSRDLAQEYIQNYGDIYSQKYYKTFIYDNMVKDFNLRGKNALDAMCGPGQLTKLLLESGATVTGLDLSSEMVSTYKARYPQCDAVCASFLDPTLPDNSFDYIFCAGGLHHLHPHVDQAFTVAHRLLKKGGHFCFAEPHTSSIFDQFRRKWYSFDPYFADNEAALNIKELENKFQHLFEYKKNYFAGFGYIAYFFVYNSMIFRIPFKIKKIYSNSLIWLQSFLSRYQTERLSTGYIGRWTKK